MSESHPLLLMNPPSPEISPDIQRKLRLRANNASLAQWCMDLMFLVICAGYYTAIISTLSCAKYPEVCSKVGGAILDSGLYNTMPEDSWIMDLNGTTPVLSSNGPQHDATDIYIMFGFSMMVKTCFWVSNIFVVIYTIEEFTERAKFLTKLFAIGRVATGFLDTVVLVGGYLHFEANDSMVVGIFGIMVYPMCQLFYVLGSLYILVEIIVSLKATGSVDVVMENVSVVEEFEMTEVVTI